MLGREAILELSLARLGSPTDRSVDTLVSRLRRKLEPPEGVPPVIKTVRGAGYMLASKVERVIRPKSLARSLEARTVAVLLLAILAVHCGALLLYRQSATAAADDAFARQVANQLTLAREAVLRRPPRERDAEAKALSSPHF